MTTQVLEAKDMAKKSAAGRDKAMGPIIARNLYRLGYGEMNVKSGEVAAKVSEKTGKPISRQRISQMMNAARIEPDTIEMLAKGLGVKVSELLREDDVILR
jgi:hypothetical protein